MTKQFYEIDKNGFIIEIHALEINEDGTPVDWSGENRLIDVQPAQGLYKLKWNGTEWVEGETEEERAEREALEKLIDLIPSAEEIADSEIEIKVLTLLIEMEVV